MSSSLALRHARYLSTAAGASASSSSSAMSMSKAISKLKSEFDPDKALEIYSSVSDEISSPVMSRLAQELAVKRLARSRRFADIETILESRKKDPKITEENYLSSLIRSYGIAGMLDHALKTYEQMDELGTPKTTISFNVLLSACNQSQRCVLVQKLFDEIPQRNGISPDNISYNILVKSYCESGSPEMAIAKLREMERKKVEVSLITYTTILAALYKQGDISEAKKVWNEMVEKGFSPDVAAYNVKLMHAQNGEPEKVQRLIDEMIKAGLRPDSISYNYLITSYCKRGMMDEAEKVYRGLAQNKCKPNAATYRTLIYHMCKNGDFEKGFELFKKSVKDEKIPNFHTLRNLVQGLVKNSKREEAEEVCGIVRNKKFPPSAFSVWAKVEKELGLSGDPSGGSGAKTVG
ncbi:hypothetical protein NMG60_11026168 [Bertholletia excelsa]